ncbi:hypothetical protein [Nonomuraea sp. NPDC049709]|uniref:hypothetical protein n=1 Tax=Nonomuraea sp. NPDC049709 TaxID=3154736 RepID=UPI0034431ABD
MHDTYSAMHPILTSGPSYAELGDDLAQLGLRYVQGRVSTGASLPEGRSMALSTDPAELATELEPLGEYEAWNGLLADLAPHLASLFPLLGMDLAPGFALGRDGRDNLVAVERLAAGEWLAVDPWHGRDGQAVAVAAPYGHPLVAKSAARSAGSRSDARRKSATLPGMSRVTGSFGAGVSS